MSTITLRDHYAAAAIETAWQMYQAAHHGEQRQVGEAEKAIAECAHRIADAMMDQANTED